MKARNKLKRSRLGNIVDSDRNHFTSPNKMIKLHENIIKDTLYNSQTQFSNTVSTLSERTVLKDGGFAIQEGHKMNSHIIEDVISDIEFYPIDSPRNISPKNLRINKLFLQ